jgi:hypothetical protein
MFKRRVALLFFTLAARRLAAPLAATPPGKFTVHTAGNLLARRLPSGAVTAASQPGTGAEP